MNGTKRYDLTNYRQFQRFHFGNPTSSDDHHWENEGEIDSSFVLGTENMKQVMKLVDKVANGSSTVMLIGESGVGKEVIASQIHKRGPRRDKPFIKVNCGAIPENLLESELFGYRKGAFTGADPNGKDGYFTLANGGVIVLDEVTEMSLSLQVKLLRVIQEREVIPLGGTEPIKIDVQIISCTNKNIEKLVEDGLFREDLYYRLNVVPIYIPPLRERVSDIPLLVHHFIEKLKRKYQHTISFSADALKVMKSYPWYGNVRELENVVERIFITAESNIVDASVVRQNLPATKTAYQSGPVVSQIMPLHEAIEIVEEQLVLMAMKQCKSISLAAKALGLSQPTMSRKYQKIREKLARQEKTDLPDSQDVLMLEKELEKQLRSVSIVLAASIDIEKLKQLEQNLTAENPCYEQLQKHLTTIRKQEGEIEWSYIWKVTEDGRIVNLVTDKKLPMMPGEEYAAPEEMHFAIYEALNGRTSVTPKYRDIYGEYKSSITPIRDEEGKVFAVLGVDFTVPYIDKQIEKLRKCLKTGGTT